MAKSTPSMFVPLDVNYMRDPRIRRAGPDAELLYLRALAYAKGGETDGFVHDFDLDAIATGCVAVVRAEHDPIRRVLTQARLNCAARAAAEADQRA